MMLLFPRTYKVGKYVQPITVSRVKLGIDQLVDLYERSFVVVIVLDWLNDHWLNLGGVYLVVRGVSASYLTR